MASPETKTATIVGCGLCQSADFRGKNVTGKMAHRQRGTIAFDDDLFNSQDATGVEVIISNSAAGSFNARWEMA